jgi:hypothetical protein
MGYSKYNSQSLPIRNYTISIPYAYIEGGEELTTSTTGIRDISSILEKCSLFRTKRWCNPVGLSCSKLFLGNVNVQSVGLGINGNDIAILDKRDRTSNLSLGDDMSDDETMRSEG